MKDIQCPNCFSLNPDESHYCSKCGSSLEEREETIAYPEDKKIRVKDTLRFSPGEKFGTRYKIIEEIGRGGMGRVYKAEDTELWTTIAIKLIRPKYSANKRFLERFKKETLLARSITHENVIRIHDIGDIEGIKYISMDFIEGQSLRDLIHSSGKLAIDTVIKITKQICEALKAAHKKGIVHRDLKPQNVMIDKTGQVYVMDFGLAKGIKTQEATVPGAIFGTPQYIPPEQAKGEKVDGRSDIYAMGTIMYEMMTGRPVFEAKTTGGYIVKHLTEKPSSPRKHNPLIPESIEKIILKCLEKDREKRYQDVDELIRDLEEGVTVSAKMFSRVRTNKWVASALVVFFAAFIFTVIYVYKSMKKPETIPISPGDKIPLLVTYFENNTGEDTFDIWGRYISDLIVFDLMQSKYVRPIKSAQIFDIHRELGLLNVVTYSEDSLKQVASHGGVDFIIHGHLHKSEEIFRIDTEIRDTSTWEILGTPFVKGRDVYLMVDNLTRMIKAVFKISEKEIENDYDKQIQEITTKSLEAWNDYILGDRYYHERKFEDSIEILQKAIELDPDFAMAHRLIAVNYHYLGRNDHAEEALFKALALTDRVSLREQYMIRAYNSYVRNDSPLEAIQLMKDFLNLYPEDVDGNVQLGSWYRNLEEWDLSLDRFETGDKLDSSKDVIHTNIQYILKAKGLYRRAREHLLKNKGAFLNPASYLRHMITLSLCEGKYELALEELNELLSVEPENSLNVLYKGRIHLTMDNFMQAQRSFLELAESSNPTDRILGHQWLSYLKLTQGKYSECHEIIQKGLDLSRKFHNQSREIDFLMERAYLNIQTGHFTEALDASIQTFNLASQKSFGYTSDKEESLLFQGLAHAKMGSIAQAEQIAVRLKEAIDISGHRKNQKFYHYLKGTIALEKNLISQAIDYFEIALSLISYQKSVSDEHAFYLDALARAEYARGNLDKACDLSEQIATLTTGKLKWGDRYVMSFYKLGKLYQKKNWAGKAIENYRKFIDLWKSTDYGINELEDAKNQVRALDQD
jgi:tetratricopeptide (TPR) repeat protein